MYDHITGHEKHEELLSELCSASSSAPTCVANKKKGKPGANELSSKLPKAQ